MFSTDFIFRQQENLVNNQKCWAGFRPLCNKILFPYFLLCNSSHNSAGPFKTMPTINLNAQDFIERLQGEKTTQ